MRWRSQRCAATLVASLVGGCACGPSHDATDARTPPVVSRIQLQLRCQPQASLLRCQAFASDREPSAPDDHDVTATVRWTSADPRVVHVEQGHIRVDRGGLTTVTATWVDGPGTPSASIFVVGDPGHREARQAYVVEGEVRVFPSSAGARGARVSLINERGIQQTVTTPSELDSLGQFRFQPVVPGTYRLRVTCEGYRATETAIVVPDTSVRTLTLLPEPTARS